LKAHGDGRWHQAKEGNAASEIARGIRRKQGNIEGALRNSEAAAFQQRRVKDETLKAEASLATLMATHNLPRRTIIFDGFLPFLTLFTTFKRFKRVKRLKVRKSSKNGPEKVRIELKSPDFHHYSSLDPVVRNAKFCSGPTGDYARSVSEMQQ